MRTRLLPLGGLLSALLGLAACGAPPAPPGRFGALTPARPRVASAPSLPPRTRPYVRLLRPLGASEVRDLGRLRPQDLEHMPQLSAGSVRALEQMAGSRLVWHVELGSEPWLGFTPLRAVASPGACRMRLGVRDAARSVHELYRLDADLPAAPAESEVTIDLGRWSGQAVDLLFEVDPLGPAGPSGPTRADWGSPTLYDRVAVRVATPARPNILLIGIDTLRVDALGAYGRDPSPTPAMDSLAGESDQWLDAYSTFNVTNPSFVSLMTGLYGKNHGIYGLSTPLPASQTTLAELLAGAGYDTAAIVSAQHLGDHNSGLGQGFGQMVLAKWTYAAELAVNSALDWLGEERQKPFFLWLHLFDPHSPHTAPLPYALGWRAATASGLSPAGEWLPFRELGPLPYTENAIGGNPKLYLGEVAYLDRQLDRLLGYLRSRGLLAHTLVALVSDHGENLGEHGVQCRHPGLFDTTTHVPLLVRWPGETRTGRRLGGLVQHLDLFPTLLRAAGLEPPPSDGLDLRELTGAGRPGRRAVFAEHSEHLGEMVRTAEASLYRSRGQSIFFPVGDYFYDLRRDPLQEHNLAGGASADEGALSALLDRWLADHRGAPQPPARELSEEERQRLQALGYI